MCCVCLIGGGFGFFAVQDSFALNPSERRYIFAITLTLKTFRAQKSINLKCEWWVILFPPIYCSTKKMPKCLEEILTRTRSK
jgi:hypothetical protein